MKEIRGVCDFMILQFEMAAETLEAFCYFFHTQRGEDGEKMPNEQTRKESSKEWEGLTCTEQVDQHFTASLV